MIGERVADSVAVKLYRCGAYHTKNVRVRSVGVPYGPDGWLLVYWVVGRHCRAEKTLRDGIEHWHGEQVEAAMLRPEDRPTLELQSLALTRLGALLTCRPEPFAEEQRIRAALPSLPYHQPTEAEAIEE
jgi:hypothetical protein